MLQLANENPLGIKIKEITKPEEIRITDDQPKPFNPFKSTTTTTTTTTTTSPTTTTISMAPTTPTSVSTTVESSSDEIKSFEIESSTTSNSLTTESTLKESKELFTEDTNQSRNVSEHVSREYTDDDIVLAENSSNAPPTKASADGEVEPEVLLTSADSNSISDDSGNKSIRQTVEHSTSGETDQSSEANYFSSTTEMSTESSTSVSDSTTENSEIVDLISSSTPKNVVVVQQGGKTESFHITGTDGLQRVEELEVVQSSTTESSHEESVDGITSEQTIILSTDMIGGRSSEEMIDGPSTSTTSLPESFDDVTDLLAVAKKFDQTLINESSTENLSSSSIEVSTSNDGISESTSELMSTSEKMYETVYYETKSTASPLNEESYDTVFYGSIDDITDSLSSSTTRSDGISSSTDGNLSTTEQNSESSSTIKIASTEPTETSSNRFSFEDEEVTPAENPEYPYIPDDVSIHHKDMIEDDEKRRLPSKIADETISSTAGPCIDCVDDVSKYAEISTTQGLSIENLKMSHKMDIIESRAPGEPHLIPEWERSTTEKTSIIEESTTLGPKDITTAINDINKMSILDESISKVNKSAALTVETLPNDVDSDEKYGRKEPTTERSTTKGYSNDDIEDDLTNSAQSEFESSTVDGASPKDDAESIKVNSSGSDSDENQSYTFDGSKMPISFLHHFEYLRKINNWPTWM